MSKSSLLAFPFLLLLLGCEDKVTFCSQACEDTSNGAPSGSANATPITLGPGERESVKVILKNLPPGAHIDISAKNGALSFAPDTNPAHIGPVRQSIAVSSVLGKTQQAFVTLSPSAQALLRERATGKH